MTKTVGEAGTILTMTDAKGIEIEEDRRAAD